jgi:hypothetical protein
MWGLLLIGLGAAVFVEGLDLFDLWHYWPLIMIVIGINAMIGYPTARQFTRGLWTAFIGVWLFAVFEGMFGLTFNNSWPFMIIGWGVILILQPFIKQRLASNTECGYER